MNVWSVGPQGTGKVARGVVSILGDVGEGLKARHSVLEEQGGFVSHLETLPFILQTGRREPGKAPGKCTSN